MTRLKEIERRLSKTTPGEWTQTGHWVGHPRRGSIIEHCCCEKLSDADFIVRSRVDIQWLISEVKRLQAENEKLKADMRGVCGIGID